jgi:1,4-dihydroxy-2-naphthoyl-CoA synthase
LEHDFHSDIFLRANHEKTIECGGRASTRQVRVLVLTGNGKAFCSGADLRGVSPDATYSRRKLSGLSVLVRRVRSSSVCSDKLGAAVYDRILSDFYPVARAIMECPKLVIAAVNVRDTASRRRSGSLLMSGRSTR